MTDPSERRSGDPRGGEARLVFGLSFASTVLLAMCGIALADAASPTVTAAAGGNGVPLVFGHAAFDLADVGYERSEFFIEGTASAYLPSSPLTNDGKWTVAPATTAAYKSRIVVNRPIHAADFNGAVLVEWLNVFGGADASPHWQHMHVELIRGGYVWVGVSAQAVGLNQLKCAAVGPGCPAPGDPVRYASLSHPVTATPTTFFLRPARRCTTMRRSCSAGSRPSA
jgi:hypothetical protein